MDTLESVDAEILKLREQANKSDNQFELDRLGAKLSELYKKKVALTPTK